MKLLASAFLLIALGFAQVRSPAPASAKSAGLKWTLSYLYDEDNSRLVLTDLKFPTPDRGIAAGRIVGDNERNVVLVTSDAGRNWALVTVKDPPASLFFLNESVGWMVTPKGTYKTVESGRSWKKQRSPKQVRRVYFLTEQRGFALCGQKSVFETDDGGENWQLLPASQEPSSNPDHTAYETIDFVGPRGMITGWSNPPREDSRLPDWMEPEKAMGRREWPTLNIVLETLDGGKSWKSQTAPIFGRISRVDLAEDGRGLAVLTFRNSFEVPSEVVSVDWKNGSSTPVFHRNDRRVTDVLIEPGAYAYVAAIETPPQLPHSPIPGRLRILRSENLSLWEEMNVDYRASGTRAILAASGRGQLWAATDSGAILKLSDVTNK